MSRGVDGGRRRFLTASTVVVGGVGAAAGAVPFVAAWLPSARAKAIGAPVKIDISKLQPGGRVTVEWRGKPVIIFRSHLIAQKTALVLIGYLSGTPLFLV